MLSKPSTQKIYWYTFLTLGFYFFYWCSHSRDDIQRSARQMLIPSTWLLALPGGNYYWMWQYSEALETVSFKRIKAGDTFLIYLLATAFWYLAFNAFNLPDTSNSGNPPVAFIIGALIVLAVVQIAGLAFFCATIQKKINSATIHQPASPFV